MNTWAELEKAVASELQQAYTGLPERLPYDVCEILARVAIDKVRELRLTAVLDG